MSKTDFIEEGIKLKPEVKAKWLAALRSGEYNQTTSVLCRLPEDDGENGEVVSHCCLGVLCELAKEDGLPMRVTEHRLGFDEDLITKEHQRVYSGQKETPPKSVMEWAFNFPHGTKKAQLDANEWENVSVSVSNDDRGEPEYEALFELNDGGLSFEQIADYIEEQL